MTKNLLFAGIDVDENSFNVALISKKTGEFFHFQCKPNSGALIKKLDSFKSKGFLLKICYESTYLGFSLCREIRKHDYDCEVIASSLIPEVPGKKVKTDKVDCRNLATYYMQGLLTVISMPDKDDEAERDLLRSRSFLVGQMKALKTHISSACKRMNIDWKNSTGKTDLWTKSHRIWLDKAISELGNDELLKVNLSCLVSSLNQLETTIDYYNHKIEELSRKEKYLEKVKSLTAFRGIQTLTAMTVVAEIGNINRFPSPRQLVSYLGLDIIEYSSGGREKKFGITKMGNRHARTALVEANQMSRRPSNVSRYLSERRSGVEPKQIAVADRCMKRLSKKAYQMNMKGKSANVIKTACAREMVGFIWESLKNVAA